MSTIGTETTLGEVVTAHPQLARELERRGLDYCCGGQRSIAEACRAIGLDPSSVAADLAAMSDVSDAEPWSTMGVVEFVDHIESIHHRYLWDELPRLTALLDKIVGVHRELALASAPPAFRFGSVENPISMMVIEHDHVGELLTRLRTATDDYGVPVDGCASYRACFEALAELEADTHLHVHKENNVLFPAVVQLEQSARAGAAG